MPKTPKKKKGQVWRFFFVLHLYAFLGLLALALLIAGSAALVWNVPKARAYVHSQVVRYYLRKVAPKLPFTIDNVDVDANWHDFLNGKISDLSFALLWDGWQIHLSGPIQMKFIKLEQDERHLSATYSPEMELIAPARDATQIPKFPVQIDLVAEENFAHLDRFSIHSKLDSWKWNMKHLLLDGLALTIDWEDGKTNAQFSCKSALFFNPESEYKLNVKDVALSANAPIVFAPFRFGPAVNFRVAASAGEARSERTTLNMPLSSLPLSGIVAFLPESEKLTVMAGSDTSPALSIDMEIDKAGGKDREFKAKWKTERIPIKEFLASVMAIAHGSPLHEFRRVSGEVETSGTARVPLPITPDLLKNMEVTARIAATGVAFEWPEKYLAASGLSLNLPISSKTGIQGSVAIEKLLFRKLRASLSPTELLVQESGRTRKNFKVHFGNKDSTLPLKLQNSPLKFGSLDGTLSLPSYTLTTSVKLASTDVGSFADSLCIKPNRIPPAKIEMNFSKVEFSPGTVDPTGKIHIDLFGGSIELDDIGIYNLGTAVPEINFNLDVKGVRLDRLGDWSGFGEMDGTLEAYAHDVVMQAWLPTQYDFKFEVAPLSHPWVVFSPDAMKNLAKMVATEQIDHLPGVVSWFSFGWPSRIVGGFDLYFFGLSLFSHGGSILMEVLDPQNLPDSLALAHKQKHYILYGNRFKIPLNSANYPVLIDAAAVSNYVSRLDRMFQNLAQAKKKKPKEIVGNEEPQLDCVPPTL